MPKRDRCIVLDGRPEQAVSGQIQRGRLSDGMPAWEREVKLGSAAKYRAMAQHDLTGAGQVVEECSSGIQPVVPTAS